jgi:hypothetical protein
MMKEVIEVNRKITVAVLALTLLMTFSAVAPAFGCLERAATTITHGNAYDMDYTQITGTLGDAAYII